MKAYKPQIEAFFYSLPRPTDGGSEQEAPAVRVKLRPLTQAERMQVLDEIYVVVIRPDGTSERHSRSWQQARELVLTNLLAVENHPAGPFDSTWSRARKEEYLTQFDVYDLMLIGNEVRERAEVRDDVKD